ncbi:MAG: TolC family protein, partial [Rhodobacteraceae bacterium]|nr:TolC family protein [Paracoccaceae bacterium]
SVEAARAALEAARAGRRPSLVAAVSGRPRAGGGGADVSADLQFRYELSTGGQREAAVAQAEAGLAEQEAEREELRRQILRTLDTVRSDQRTGAARLAAARDALAANEAAREAAREQFAVGRRSISQLLDAQRDVFAAAEALAEAELDLALSGYAALGLTGDILDVFGMPLTDIATMGAP